MANPVNEFSKSNDVKRFFLLVEAEKIMRLKK